MTSPWTVHSDGAQALLDDPATAGKTLVNEHIGGLPLDVAVDRMLPLDDVLRKSGHYGPRVEVPDDADVQTRLLAFIGRHP